MTEYVLIDRTAGAATQKGEVMTPRDLAGIAAVCQIQINRDFAAENGGACRVRAGDEASIGPNERPFFLRDVIPVAGAIADHSVDDAGQPVLEDAITLSETLTGPGNSVSCAVSHELLETERDQGANQWADGAGTVQVPLEVADPVENQAYPITAGEGTPEAYTAHVSNFVLEAWFVPNHKGPYDQLTLMGDNPNPPPAPLTNASGDGYHVERDIGSSMVFVQGKATHVPPHVRIVGTAKRRPWRANSRRCRRGIAEPND